MKSRFALATLIVGALLVAGSIVADDKKKEEKEKEFSAKCFVSGQPAEKSHVVDYKGKKLYFCCDNCPAAFKADPKKFAAKAHHQLATTGQMVQVACPYSGKAVDPDTAIEVAGVKVAFCCKECKGKTEKADDKVALVFGDIEKGFTLQTECPISGKAIDVTKTAEYEGKKVYFCCDKCPAAFKADPKKYLDKLPQFAKEEKAK